MPSRSQSDDRGQSIVEFALALPILLLLVVGLMEFALVENSRNTVNFAARDASILAAEGGKSPGVDCVVIQAIENDIVSPARNLRITYVDIYWSDVNGNVISNTYQRYTRGGTTTCTFGDGSTVTVPYTLTTNAYPESSRCDVLLGCGSPHTTLDTIGVTVVYEHAWVTAFPRITGSPSITLRGSSATRMEPTL